MKRSFHDTGYSLSMQETVDFFLNKPKFGFEGYEPRATHENMKPPRAFKQPVSKRDTFMTTVPKITSHVPAPTRYETTYDWKKMEPEHS
jgi:hypothetical protein